MQTQTNINRWNGIIRWIVPIAAMLALAAWFYIAPVGALGKLDAVGYAVCHRISERSFHIEERQLPLCARCTGEFNAAAMALIFQIIVSGKRSKLPSRSMGVLLFLFFLAFGIDGSNSYLYLIKQTARGALDNIPNLYIPNNTLRLFTGSGMGITLAAVLYPVMNQTLWRETDERRALDWKSFGLLVLITLIVDLLVLTDSPIILYPIAYLSAFGVLALLTIIFSMVWIMIMRQDNTFDHPRQLWLAAASGLTLGLLLILGIDLFRFQLTHTWGGFPLG
jgi:uncharacterized membrane protein